MSIFSGGSRGRINQWSSKQETPWYKSYPSKPASPCQTNLCPQCFLLGILVASVIYFLTRKLFKRNNRHAEQDRIKITPRINSRNLELDRRLEFYEKCSGILNAERELLRTECDLEKDLFENKYMEEGSVEPCDQLDDNSQVADDGDTFLSEQFGHPDQHEILNLTNKQNPFYSFEPLFVIEETEETS